VTAPARTAADARLRILESACDVIAAHGIDDVRIARIATLAGVSPALVHYHFETRDSLLAEALEHSFELLGDFRTTHADSEGWTAAQRLGWMIDQSLPFPGLGDREWRLWLELWGRAARQPELRAVAARLYERYDAWIAGVVDEGVASGEFTTPDPRAATQRLIAAIDGTGLRVLVDDPAMTLERARALVERPGVEYEIGWRTPVLGQAWAALRGMVHGEARLYVDALMARQSELDAALVEAIAELRAEVDDLRRRVDQR
jgi:AcrR family transcriptional regulator